MNHESSEIEKPQVPYYKMSVVQLIIAFMLFFVGFMLSGGLQIVAMQFLSTDVVNEYIQPLIYAFPFAFTLVTYYIIYLKPENLHYHFGFQLSKWYDYPVMILMFLGLMILTEPLAEAIPTSGAYGVLDKMWDLMEMMEDSIRQYPVSSTFMVVILAPIFEELFFRGLILKGLLNNKVPPALAIIFSALLFGIIHFNPWQFVGAFILGSALGFVYYKTQSLLNTILLHFFNNALGIIIFFSTDEMNYSEFTESSLGESLIFGAVLFILFAYLFVKLTKNHQWKYY